MNRGSCVTEIKGYEAGGDDGCCSIFLPWSWGILLNSGWFHHCPSQNMKWWIKRFPVCSAPPLQHLLRHLCCCFPLHFNAPSLSLSLCCKQVSGAENLKDEYFPQPAEMGSTSLWPRGFVLTVFPARCPLICCAAQFELLASDVNWSHFCCLSLQCFFFFNSGRTWTIFWREPGSKSV